MTAPGAGPSMGEELAASVLDIRPAWAFLRLHFVDAVNIPLEELKGRAAELPPKNVPLVIFDVAAARAEAAANALRAAGRLVSEVRIGDHWLTQGVTATGEPQNRLWRPHALLKKAIQIAEGLWGGLTGRAALDAACGSGRDAVYLAIRGFTASGCDILPDALDRCRDLARRHRVHVETFEVDLRHWRPAAEQYDLVCCFRFLHQPAMPLLANAVRPGGILVCETFARFHDGVASRPRSRGNLVDFGEMVRWVVGWRVLVHQAEAGEDGRLLAGLIARRPP